MDGAAASELTRSCSNKAFKVGFQNGWRSASAAAFNAHLADINARVDGAKPMRFFFDILLPMSRTNIAALFVILFIYGWNQYLWPLLITTEPEMNTIVMGIKQMFPSGDDFAHWPTIMATSILAMVPPVIVVIGMQKLFIRGLVESEK